MDIFEWDTSASTAVPSTPVFRCSRLSPAVKVADLSLLAEEYLDRRIRVNGAASKMVEITCAELVVKMVGMVSADASFGFCGGS